MESHELNKTILDKEDKLGVNRSQWLTFRQE